MNKVRTLVLGVALLGLAACVPTFPEEAQLAAVDSAPWVAVNWPAATGANDDYPVDGYLVSVDGIVVSTVESWAEGCQLNGLADNTTYTLEVKARDSRDYWSEPLTVQHTTGVLGSTDPEISCSTAPPPPE
jgi:chitodextrinase